jgi:hypothetical protein
MSTDNVPEQQPSRWCLVGNIVEERPYGEGGKETKRGTKHFAPGAKVYCLTTEWGDLCCENLLAISRHRKSGRLITISIRTDWVTNWRAKLVYHTEVLRRIDEANQGSTRGLTYLWTSKDIVEEFVTFLKRREDEGRKA